MALEKTQPLKQWVPGALYLGVKRLGREAGHSFLSVKASCIKSYHYIVSRTALGPTQPPIQWALGTLSLGVRRPGREAD